MCGVIFRHRQSRRASQRYIEHSSNPIYTPRFSGILRSMCFLVLDWAETFSQDFKCLMCSHHQVWDFSEVVWYFFNFNWICARTHRLIIQWLMKNLKIYVTITWKLISCWKPINLIISIKVYIFALTKIVSISCIMFNIYNKKHNSLGHIFFLCAVNENKVYYFF